MLHHITGNPVVGHFTSPPSPLAAADERNRVSMSGSQQRSYVLPFKATQDARVLRPDLLELMKRPLWWEVLRHAVEHLLALRHGAVPERRPETTQYGKDEDNASAMPIIFLMFASSSCTPSR